MRRSCFGVVTASEHSRFRPEEFEGSGARAHEDHHLPCLAMGESARELPELADLVGAFLAQCSGAEQKVLLALAERIAAEQYRTWAEKAGADDRDGLLDAAVREERVAAALEAMTPDAAETSGALNDRFPMLAPLYRSVLQ